VVLSWTDLAGTATLTCSAPSRSRISCKCCGSGSVPQLGIPYAADDPVVGCVRGLCPWICGTPDMEKNSTLFSRILQYGHFVILHIFVP
jgi:hypothetical protein